ncbi:hypothetical protein AYI69_g7200, partial [Smittium culicis]
MKKRKIDK